MKTKFGYRARSKKALRRFLGFGNMGCIIEYRRDKIVYSQFERTFHMVHRLVKRIDYETEG